MMDLNILWFILITVLFTGFFFLEGFDYGVGGILPFLSSDEKERGEVLRTITPVWDGNEVWMITAVRSSRPSRTSTPRCSPPSTSRSSSCSSRSSCAA